MVKKVYHWAIIVCLLAYAFCLLGYHCLLTSICFFDYWGYHSLPVGHCLCAYWAMTVCKLHNDNLTQVQESLA